MKDMKWCKTSGFLATAMTMVPRVRVSLALMLSVACVLFCCDSRKLPVHNTTVSIEGRNWMIDGVPMLNGSPAEGLLVNVRMVNAVFEDSGPVASDHLPPDFDPDKNTLQFIEKIPDYYAHGVRGFTVSLQGGLPGYEGAVNTAFHADGSLKEQYLARVERVVRAADAQGAVIILSCFYQRQRSHADALKGKQAIRNAVANIVEWLSQEGFSNVVLEISNEYAHGGFRHWEDGEWLKSVEGQLELIRLAKAKAPTLLVSTSGMGDGAMPPALATAVDFIVIHLNTTPIDLYPEKIREVRRYGKPVLCNEDDKTGQLGAEAARVSIQSGAGWGFMHAEKNQAVPFRFEGARDDTIVYQMLESLSTPGASIAEIAARPFSVLVTAPKDGDVFPSGKPIAFHATIHGLEDQEGVEVSFLLEEKVIGKAAASPFEFVWKDATPGNYSVRAVLQTSRGWQLLRSRPVDFEVMP